MQDITIKKQATGKKMALASSVAEHYDLHTTAPQFQHLLRGLDNLSTVRGVVS